MKPVAFDYARPSTVGGALSLLGDADAGMVKIMAGSQSLGPMLNMRLVRPDLVVDITGIPELRAAREDGGHLRIGACVTHADIEDGRIPDVTAGALPTVAHGIAYRAVRNRGTIGGSVTHADPSADWISILCALGAEVTLQSADGKRRTLAVENYMVGALEVELAPDELLVDVAVPKLGRGARWGYYKLCRKTGEFAHAIGAVVSDPDRGVCRMVVGATETRPIVIADGAAMLHSDGPGGALALDQAALDARVREAGMHDPIDRQIHLAALRRAVDQANRP